MAQLLRCVGGCGQLWSWHGRLKGGRGRLGPWRGTTGQGSTDCGCNWLVGKPSIKMLNAKKNTNLYVV
jgi:hypothetical protein